MAVLLALVLTVATAQQAPVPVPDIVVVGNRLKDSKAALDACLARNCPPDEDIDASLGHAENQVAAGDYRAARTTLLRALGRNKDEAKAYPEPVSDLYRANALVANHLGFEQDYFSSTYAILRALKAGIPEPDHRHFGARMEIAAMLARMRGSDRAQRAYEALAEDADKAGRADIGAIARLRAAWQNYLQLPGSASRGRIAAIAADDGPQTKVAAAMAKLYLARIARAEGKEQEAEALIRQVARRGLKAPVLVHAPPYQLSVQELEPTTDPAEISAGAGNPARRYGGNFEDKWIDVSFLVQPDGRVAEVEVLRKGGDADWAKPLVESIRGRLYAPLKDGVPAYRLERYTYTSGYESQTGSHIRQRSPRARVEYLDLTAAAPEAGAKERAAQ